MDMPIYLALKELWRNKGKFFSISLVIGLITTLVIFVAALSEGLGAGNREYLQKLNGELIIYNKNADLLINFSQLARSKLAEVQRVPGVRQVGPISFSSVSVLLGGDKRLNVSMVGLEPGKPGEPPVLAGQGLRSRSGREAIIERNMALRTGLRVGDDFTVKSTQAAKDQFYTLKVVGISDGRQYSLQPTMFVPLLTWDEIRPTAVVNESRGELTSHIIAVQLENPDDQKTMKQLIEDQVAEVVAVDRVTAYENTPGYSAQQSTLNTQGTFVLLIGTLVIGGFFQIQTLQKVPQTGMLKAIGTSNLTIALAAIVQIIAVTTLGVLLGGAAILALKLIFPPTIPIVFTGNAALGGIAAIMLIGPIAGIVSIRYALKVEPLKALGL
jgi:putative ABC transport system permease protein